MSQIGATKWVFRDKLIEKNKDFTKLVQFSDEHAAFLGKFEISTGAASVSASSFPFSNVV